jgi:hypothetical protein
VRLADYLDALAEECAAGSEIEWIKKLRQLDVTGQPLRRRFTLRGDSLWWFAELYLHKQQVVLNAHRTIAALDALVARERPKEMAVVRVADALGVVVADHVALDAIAREQLSHVCELGGVEMIVLVEQTGITGHREQLSER